MSRFLIGAHPRTHYSTEFPLYSFPHPIAFSPGAAVADVARILWVGLSCQSIRVWPEGAFDLGGFWPVVALQLGGVWPQGANDRRHLTGSVWPGAFDLDSSCIISGACLRDQPRSHSREGLKPDATHFGGLSSIYAYALRRRTTTFGKVSR